MTIYEKIVEKNAMVGKLKQEELKNIYEEKELRKMAETVNTVIEAFIIDIIRARREIALIKDQQFLLGIMAYSKEPIVIRGIAIKTYLNNRFPPL